MAPTTATVILHYLLHHHLLHFPLFINLRTSSSEFPPFSSLPNQQLYLGFCSSSAFISPSIDAIMGFFAEDSGLIVTHLLYKAALVLALLRYALSWALKFWNDTVSPPSSRRRRLPSTQQIRDRLILTTFADVAERRSDSGENENGNACAVCLNQMNPEDEVRELRNCCHVFHRDCIDRWIDHELDSDDHEEEEDESNHRTCPLCRTPLLTASQSLAWSAAAEQQPSWAVERILYLFGDDLLVS